MILASAIAGSLVHADLWALVIVVAVIVGVAAYAFREYRWSRQSAGEQEGPSEGGLIDWLVSGGASVLERRFAGFTDGEAERLDQGI